MHNPKCGRVFIHFIVKHSEPYNSAICKEMPTTHAEPAEPYWTHAELTQAEPAQRAENAVITLQ